MEIHGHRIHDIGGSDPILICKDCRVDYLDLDDMGFPSCESMRATRKSNHVELAKLRQWFSAKFGEVQQQFRQVCLWVRFGTITETVLAVDGGVASEIEFRGRNGKVVGFWAYGSFDPAGPYRG